jgi:hypothetical protein
MERKARTIANNVVKLRHDQSAPAAAEPKRKKRTRAEYRELILGVHKRTVECIVLESQYWNECKEDLAYGEFLSFIKKDMGWHPSTVERKMTIWRHERIRESANWHNLPPSASTLSELAKLSNAQFDAWIKRGIIRSGMSFNESVAYVTHGLEPGEWQENPEEEDESQNDEDDEGAPKGRKKLPDSLVTARKAYLKEIAKLPHWRQRRREFNRMAEALFYASPEEYLERRLEQEYSATHQADKRAERRMRKADKGGD